MAAEQVTYVGHATVLLEVDGVRLLTDPVLRKRILHLQRTAPVETQNLRDLDAVLLSHVHWDHLDLRSLRLLGREQSLIVPRGAGSLLRRHGFSRVVEVEVGEHVDVAGVKVTATDAKHDGRRGPFGTTAPALGYLVTGSSRVYFAGDTDLFSGMAELAPLDLALLPISGWGPRLPAGHLDPRRAAEALRLLEPRVVVPIHWGTYSSAFIRRQKRADFDQARVDEFRGLAAELAPAVDVRVLAPGEALMLEPIGR